VSAWWQTAVVYQIYPRSFQDSDGDGIGDLEGIRSRIDYLSWLGIDAVWLSPIYPSPMADFGYDITDYCDIDPMFGTLAGFDALLADLHARDIRLIMDFVPNHTSDRHPWFIESRKSRQSRRRNWYVWHDGRDGGPPNNWIDQTGQSAWTFDAATGQYYYHRFLPQQPDLNWYEPEVVAAMGAVLRFWLDRGVDGFRVDAATNLVEDSLLRDDPPVPLAREGEPKVRRVFTSDRPQTHHCIGQFRDIVDRYPDKVLIGEAHLPVARLMQYYGQASGDLGFQIPFNFLAISTPWNARSIEAAIDQYVMLLPAHDWPNWVLGNHDEDRIASRIGREQARIAAMFALTRQGTPFIYYGEELGLENLDLSEGHSLDAFGRAGIRSRDPERGPMPWDGSANAGFSSGAPWLPLPQPASGTCVAAERDDPHAMLTLYHRLLALRRAMRVLQTGDCLPLAELGPVLSYRRVADSERVQVALNFGGDPQPIALEHPGRVLISTALDREEDVSGTLLLRGNEGVLIALHEP
jgi:alpha-glucosidase